MPTPLAPSNLSDLDRRLFAVIRSATDRLDTLRQVLADGANPSAIWHYGPDSWRRPASALQVAMEEYHLPTRSAMVALLLDAGAEPNPPEGTDQAPVVSAVHGHHWADVRRLVHHGARLDQRVAPNAAPLYLWPINDDNPAMVRWLGRHGAALDETLVPLLTRAGAALVRKTTGLRLLNALVHVGAQVNPPSPHSTALIEVCGLDLKVVAQATPDSQERAVQRLIALGADVTRAAVHTARWTRSIDPARDVTVAWDNQGITALHWAAYHGHLQVVPHLLAQGADLHARTSHAATPAAMEQWARSRARDMPAVPAPDGGASPIEWAQAAGHAPVVALLERALLRAEARSLPVAVRERVRL